MHRTRQPFRDATCGMKHRYETRHAAWRATQHFRRRDPSQATIAVYWCKWCGFFHFGRNSTDE